MTEYDYSKDARLQITSGPLTQDIRFRPSLYTPQSNAPIHLSLTRYMAPHALIGKAAPAFTLPSTEGEDRTITPGESGKPLV